MTTEEIVAAFVYQVVEMGISFAQEHLDGEDLATAPRSARAKVGFADQPPALSYPQLTSAEADAAVTTIFIGGAGFGVAATPVVRSGRYPTVPMPCGDARESGRARVSVLCRKPDRK